MQPSVANAGPDAARTSWPTAPQWPLFPIVGIGASAGGLESLERLFSYMPRTSGMAFVVIQHLSPDFKSVIDELLARRTRIPILQAADGVEVERDTVYLLPPKKEMIIKGGRLHLTDKDPKQGLTLPIDHFFRSLAHDAGPMARAVVLSGTGTDGSRGLLEIKRMGGIVIAESEESAKFDGMPLAALNTGAVDQVLRPEEIPGSLMAAYRGKPQSDPAGAAELNETSEETIFRMLRDECGIDFSHYKTTTVGRRIERRVSLLRLGGIDEYVIRLRNDPGEVSALYEDLLIGVTRFFRDKEAFDAIEQKVVPAILEGLQPGEDVRIWVPGCATGEEAYSLAILFHEQLTQRGWPINVKLFATDVHRRSLEVAGLGFYDDASVADVRPELLKRYFVQRPNGYHVSQDIRQLIVFAPHNVFRDAPFTKLDLISCRNLLIYFQPHAQRAALSLFHFGLKTGGILFLGSSESPGSLVDEYDTLDERYRIYKKVRDVRVTERLKLPFLRDMSPPSPTTTRPAPRVTVSEAQLLSTYDALLDRFMPPSFLVNEERELADTFGGAERFLKVKGRRPSHALVDLLPETARTVVGGVLQKSFADWTAVRYRGLALDLDDGSVCVDVVAEPVENRRARSRQVLVRFERSTEESDAVESEPAKRPPVELVSEDSLVTDRVRTLEAELSYSRENLQASVEELEASNEELQATNEELVASNEELQSTNEELHSVNEELYTVNAEYQKKIFELGELNADFKHLLEATDVGILFLDSHLRIRKYTSSMEGIFRIVAQDVGRKLSDFSHRLDRQELIRDVEEAAETGAMLETDVRDDTGRCFFLRVLPYRPVPALDEAEPAGPDAPKKSHGVVLTFTDISTLEQARARLHKLSAIVESSDDAIVGKDLNGTITTWNGGAEQLYGYRAEEAIGMSAFDYVPPERREEETDFLERLTRGERIDHVETTRLHRDGRRIPVSVTMSPIQDSNGKIVGISAIGRDITQLVATRREVKEREEHIRLLLESMAEGVYGVDLEGVCTFANPSCARMLGYADASLLVGRPMHAHHAPAPRSDGDVASGDECRLEVGSREGRNIHADDRSFIRSDGRTFPVEFWSHPVSVAGNLVGAVVTFIDIAERKQAEEEIRIAARRREEFLAMLSHELRNPLAAVLSATTLMSTPSVEPTMIEAARQVVQRQAAHMARLLDDLLDVARITRGAVGLQKRVTDLRESAKSAAEALRPLFESHKTELVLEMPDVPLPVHGDPDRLQQIHANLFGNAVSYSANGARVHVTLTRSGSEVVLAVKDEGIGIDRDLLPHIFELFVQGQQNLDRSRGGLGIGLTLVKKLVELHGGSVSARSDGAGHGSEFVVHLPLCDQAVAEESVRRLDGHVPRKIVLVEDHDDSRKLLKTLLETKGYAVAEAADGRSAISAIQTMRPDVALVDIGLPGIDGYEVARTIRADVSNRDLILVALTGYGRDSDVRRAKEAGFNHHLTKPVRPEVLDALLVEL